MNNVSSDEEKEIIEIIELLHQSFKGADNTKIKEINDKLNEKFTNLQKGISLLLKSLSLKSIKNFTIPLDIHVSIIIYLKNILLTKQNELNPKDITSFLEAILDLVFTHNSKNDHLNNSKIFNIIKNIISIISTSPLLYTDTNYMHKSLKIMLESVHVHLMKKDNNILKIMKSAIILSTALLTSKGSQAESFEQLMNNYYIPIINIIFQNVPNYINPKNNIYNDEYICILKHLYDGLYLMFTKMRYIFDNEKRKEIGCKLFREYGVYSYELLNIMPTMDEVSTKKYNNNNPIIVFNTEEQKCYEINHMKGRILQFISTIIQISTLEVQRMNEENQNCINDKELVELVNKIIILIISSFEDILNNQQKFIFIRRYSIEEFNDNDDCFNAVLFQMFIFLLRSLIREPIKSDFSLHIKKFLLNILFPLIITIDDELNFLNIDPEGYHQYINDITNEFKDKNFRTCACFLILKISEKFDNMINFNLSFNIEMLNYILNEGKTVENKLSEYNVYLKNKKDALINKFSEVIKLDFSLLIILILKEHLKNNSFFINRFLEIIINNQEKLHLIKSPIIKIKICQIYNFFSSDLFQCDNKNIGNEIKNKLIENAINFLLNNIVQKKMQKDEDYIQALAFEASDTLIEILNLPKVGNELLLKYMSQILEKNFSVFNQLIEIIDVYSFYLVLEQIIAEIQINQRDLLFVCLNNLAKKFRMDYLKNKKSIKIFGTQCFNIFRNFLTGKNKINNSNKEEIQKFNKIFEPLLNYIQKPKKFELYDELILTCEDYIKALNGINNLSVLILKNIKKILDLENTMNSTCFSFTSTFLANIQNDIGGSEEVINQEELFNEILIIIKKSFTYNNETLENSKLNALLLTLQVIDLNPNINEETLSFLINNSFNSYQTLDDLEAINDNIYKKNQISVTNICLSFVFKPKNTFNILNNSFIINEESKTSKFEQFLYFIYFVSNVTYPDYCPLLGKCVILGMCSILNDEHCMNYMNNNNKDTKLMILKIFINFVINHKKEKTLILNNIMKKELNCNFVEEEEKEDDDEDGEIDFIFNNKVELALSGNQNIKNSDEFKYFTQIMKNIKEKDEEIYNTLINDSFNGNDSTINELYKIRNIKIKYNDKEYTVPRRTVRIKRK